MRRPTYATYAGPAPITDLCIQGTMRATGGLCEAALGASIACATGATGVGAIGGCMLAAHGIDNFQAGFKQAWTGDHHEPGTVQLLQKAGMSHEGAAIANDVLSAVGCGWGGMVLKGGAQGAIYGKSCPDTASSMTSNINAQNGTNFIVGAEGVTVPLNRKVLETGL